MQTLESLKRRLRSARDLQGIVRTMKALAAIGIRQYEKAVESLAEYNRTVELGFLVLLRRGLEPVAAASKEGRGTLALVFGSDQGLCGSFNEQIVAEVLRRLDPIEPDSGQRVLFAVGVRAAWLLEEAGQAVQETFPLPGTSAGVTGTVQSILMKLEAVEARRPTARILLFHHKRLSGLTFRAETTSLVPLDREWFEMMARKRWPTRVLPTFTMDPDRLLSALIRQYLFVSLYAALADSIASESAARLQAMQVAERTIGERIEDLTMKLWEERRRAITEELLDTISGAQAVVERPL